MYFVWCLDKQLSLFPFQEPVSTKIDNKTSAFVWTMANSTVNDMQKIWLSSERINDIEAINSGISQSIEDKVGDRWYFSKIIPIKDKDKKITSLAIFSDDITERKQAEKQKEIIAHKYATVLATTSDAVLASDLDGRITVFNPGAERLFGCTADEALGSPIMRFCPEDRLEEQAEMMRRIRDTGAVAGYESERLTADGRRIPVEITLGLNTDEQGRPLGINGILRDITERKRAELQKAGLEAKVQQLQKSESLGRMAGSIAHHFNNQLSVVLGNLELVLDDLPDDADNREILVQSFEAGRKATEVSQQMLRYLGHISGSQTAINLSDVCRQSLAFLQSASPSGVTFNVDFPDSGPIVHADAGQIQQVLTNLLTNAQESLPENQGIIGLIIQTVSHEDISTSNCFPLDWHPQDKPYACLEISDTGHGISREDIEKLFDPFYTTKFTGRGMGLPVTMGILKTHNGCITVDSEPENGTVFRVYLPVSTERKPAKHEKVTTPKGDVGNGRTVLLIEDEASVRNTAKIMISRLGYKVIEAQDGVEAVRLFQEHQNEIDCVLSDLTMPRMNGWETLTALRDKGADVPVILASGYDENTVMAGDHPELPQAFLNKPYSMAALKDVLMEVIRL